MIFEKIVVDNTFIQKYINIQNYNSIPIEWESPKKLYAHVRSCIDFFPRKIDCEKLKKNRQFLTSLDHVFYFLTKLVLQLAKSDNV